MSTETFLDGRVTLHLADVRAALEAMEPESVDCVVTSPPYWGLRDYGVAGQIGLEPSLGEHIEVMLDVFRLVWRVLKPSGTCWVNYGDCYATSPNGRSAAATKAAGGDDRTFRDKPFSTVGPIQTRSNGGEGQHHDRRGGYLKSKDLCMVPNRLAIALQEDGWWVRSEIIWAKPNPMPESIRDRPATAHEKVFLLSRSGGPTCWRHRDGRWAFSRPAPDFIWVDEAGGEWAEPGGARRRVNLWAAYDYYYDADSVRQGRTSTEDAITFRGGSYPAGAPGTRTVSGNKHVKQDDIAAAARAAGASSGRRMAGFNERWDSTAKRRAADVASPRHAGGINRTGIEDAARGSRNLRNYEPAPVAVWPLATRPFSEAHFATFPPELAERCILAGCPRGGLVLDPFGGAGTTALVAARYGRRAALIEINPDYAAVARRRIEREWRVAPTISAPAERGPMSLQMIEATDEP